ncbi:MAG: hypothetical protein AW09_000734 [Candidatus Accumulibacter phosphatis]|uniref:Uncharacterized protein n=1 Tax=Candidatus Accumulibacter phosphatis TaxID=327160 RepID=A0A080M124_9PROT|nr:MAG: hypothetical protein AW09_000734 [Candidatus Accumulibacter phosphatis]
MGEFMSEQVLPCVRRWLVLGLGKKDVAADGESTCMDLLREAARLLVAVQANRGKIPAKATFHERARRCRQALATAVDSLLEGSLILRRHGIGFCGGAALQVLGFGNFGLFGIGRAFGWENAVQYFVRFKHLAGELQVHAWGNCVHRIILAAAHHRIRNTICFPFIVIVRSTYF